MTTPNNSLLANAAIEGFVAGLLTERWITKVNSGAPPAIGTPAVSYENFTEGASLWSSQIDALIAPDVEDSPQPAGTQPITEGEGLAIVPISGSIQLAEYAKTKILAALALAALEGRFSPDETPEDLTVLAEPVASAYLLFAQLVDSGGAPGGTAPVQNQLLWYAAYAGFLAGSQIGIPTSVPEDRAEEVGACAALFAYAVDAQIANDGSISQAVGGSTLALPVVPQEWDDPIPVDLTAQNQLAKFRLIYSLSLAAMEGRNPLSLGIVVEGDTSEVESWAVQVATPIAAAYAVFAPGLVTQAVPQATLYNPGFYNEAYCGFVAGALGARPMVYSAEDLSSGSADDGAYTSVVEAAETFAFAVDAAIGGSDYVLAETPGDTRPIPTDADPALPADAVTTLVDGSGDTSVVSPLTENGIVQEAELGKCGLLWAICRANTKTRYALGNAYDTAASTYAARAGSVAALFLDLVTALALP